jgi:hypothetical protein
MRVVCGVFWWFVACFARAACRGPCAFIASVTVPAETALRSIAVAFLLLAATWSEVTLASYREVSFQENNEHGRQLCFWATGTKPRGVMEKVGSMTRFLSRASKTRCS